MMVCGVLGPKSNAHGPNEFDGLHSPPAMPYGQCAPARGRGAGASYDGPAVAHGGHGESGGAPLILLGHSMGGLVAARFVALRRRPVDALVLSSPALDPGLSAVQKFLLAIVPNIAPNLRVGNGLDASYISHDPATVAAYRADPLVHDRICGRLAKFIADGGPAVVARAAQWTVPTLLMYAGADRLVNPAGSRAFAAAAPKAVVTSHCFEEHYHELFNELDREPVFAVLQQWLDARFAR
jgi:alpha-beta hydrolase superfamily lysophospholipase